MPYWCFPWTSEVTGYHIGFLMMILSIWTFYMFFVRFSLLQIKSLSLEFLDHDVYFNYNFSLIHQILIILRMGHLLHWRMFLPTHRYPILCKPFVLSLFHINAFNYSTLMTVLSSLFLNFFFSNFETSGLGISIVLNRLLHVLLFPVFLVCDSPKGAVYYIKLIEVNKCYNFANNQNYLIFIFFKMH